MRERGIILLFLFTLNAIFSQNHDEEIERLLNNQDNKALDIIVKKEKAEGETPKVLLYKSRYFQNQGNTEKTISLALRGLSLTEGVIKADYFKQLMIAYYLKGVSDSSIFYGQQLLRLPISNLEKSKANVLIANSHWTLGNISYAKDGYELALKFAKETSDSNSISSSLNGLGLIYFKSENKLKEARRCFIEAVNQTPKSRPLNKANYLINLSSVLIKQNILDSSILFLDRAEKIARNYGDTGIVFSSYVNKGVVLLLQKKLSAAESFFRKAEKLINVSGVSKTDIEALYISISDLEYEKGNYKSSRDYLKKYNLIREDRLSEEKNKKILLLQEQYNAAEKRQQISELEIKQQKSELKQKESDATYFKARLIFTAVLVVFLLVFVAIYLWYRKKKQEANKIIEIEKRKAILEAVEKEKYRFSRELHDSLGGTLSMSKLMAAQFANEEASSKISQLLQMAIDDTRRISRDLYPTVLKVSGLKPAIESLFDNLRISNPQIEFDFDMYETNLKLSDSFSLHMYRICQELTNNTIKYAQAKNVALEIDFEDEKVLVRYRDNGIGIDMNNYKTGVGMNSIQERLSTFNSTIEIISAVGEGFEVRIQAEVEKA